MLEIICIGNIEAVIRRKNIQINKCLDHWAEVAGPSAYELSGMRVLLEKALTAGQQEKK
jgi:hypothetical protein